MHRIAPRPEEDRTDFERDRTDMFSVVLFDIDGTLVDSNDAHAHAWVEAFAEFGVQVDVDKVRRSIGMGGDKLMPAVSGISEESSTGEKISKRRGEIFKTTYLPQLQPFPGARDLVAEVKARSRGCRRQLREARRAQIPAADRRRERSPGRSDVE
jgi:beta-phosphoglucomutase-like phosphatase (HAD superfamily)